MMEMVPMLKGYEDNIEMEVEKALTGYYYFP
jgi:hypothetical protein